MGWAVGWGPALGLDRCPKHLPRLGGDGSRGWLDYSWHLGKCFTITVENFFKNEAGIVESFLQHLLTLRSLMLWF